MALFGLDRLRSMTAMHGASPPIAVDFGSHHLKAIQIASGDPPTLLAAAGVATPDALLGDPAKRLAHQLESLPKVLRMVPFKGKRVVCSIPSSQLYCKHLQLQLPEGAPVSDIVAGAVGAQLKCDPASLLVRHVLVHAGGATGKSEVIAMAVGRQLVNRMMAALRAAKMEPVAIHPEPLAMLRSFDHITRRQTDTELVSLYLDLGAETTKLVVAQGTEPVFMKIIQIGGRYLDQMVAGQRRCGLEDARKQRLASQTVEAPPRPAEAPAGASGTGLASLDAMMTRAAAQAAAGGGADKPLCEAAAVAVAEPADRRSDSAAPPGCAPLTDVATGPALDLREALDTLADEVSLCLRYYESLSGGKRVGRAIFVGGESRHTGLCQAVARRLKLAAHVADPLARIARTGREPCEGVDLGGAQPGWCVPVGLSLSPTDL